MTVRRLKGRALIDEHVTLNAGSMQQYSSNNVNPLVYAALSNHIKLMQKGTAPISVIEFGARAGMLGKKLSQEYSSACYLGVEPFPPAGKNFKLFCDTCEGFTSSSLSQKILSSANIIVYADVLEHLVDPWIHLKKMYQICPAGTIVIASIPNFFHHSAMELVSNGRFQYEEWGVLDLTHLRFFGLADIIDLFESCGWHVDRPSIVPAFDPCGIKIVENFKSNLLKSWKFGRLTWSIDSIEHAIQLGAFQFILVAQKLSNNIY